MIRLSLQKVGGYTGLAALFFIGSAQAQTRLIWDSNGNMIGSELQSSYDERMQFSRDLTAYNEGRKAGAVKSAVVDGGKVVATRAATLNVAGLGRAAALGLEEFVRYPLSSVGKGLVNVVRLNPLGIAGTVAASILLEKGISAIGGVWVKQDTSTDGFRWWNNVYGQNTTYNGSTAACQAAFDWREASLSSSYKPMTHQMVPQPNGTVACHTYANSGILIGNDSATKLSTCADGSAPVNGTCPVAGLPATDGQIQQAIVDGLTSTPARAPDVLKNIYDQGGWVPLDAADQAGWNITTPTVEGKPQVTTTTSTGADGSTLTTTKTTTPKATVSSSGDNVTNNTLTYNITNITTTVTRNQAGDIVSSETTTEDKDSEVFQDAAMPEQPNLYTQKFPDGLAGVWRDNKPDVKATEFYQGVASMFPSFGGGQCPAWTTSFNLGAAGNFGNGSFTVPCWIFQALGLVILATAAFTARKIIF
ncbi:hypothetical protein [Cupriavidus necator]